MCEPDLCAYTGLKICQTRQFNSVATYREKNLSLSASANRLKGLDFLSLLGKAQSSSSEVVGIAQEETEGKG